MNGKAQRGAEHVFGKSLGRLLLVLGFSKGFEDENENEEKDDCCVSNVKTRSE